jgi:hypothetical protein
MQADRGHAAFGEYPRADPSHHADAWALGWFFSAHRAVVRTVRRRVRLGALKSPGEDKRECVEITVGQDRVAEVRPAVPH